MNNGGSAKQSTLANHTSDEKNTSNTPSQSDSSKTQNNYPTPSLSSDKDETRVRQPASDPEQSSPTWRSPAVAAAAPAHKYQPLSWHVVALLAFPSVLGVLARLGLHSLATYDGDSVFALAWVQGMGCLIMGLAVGKRKEVTEYYPPLYTAITTGFCGSLTTFSSWQLEVFQAWSNAGGFHRGWLRDVVDGLTRTVVTLLVSLGALSFGQHISSNNLFRAPKLRPNPAIAHVLSSLSLFAYFATIPLYFKLSPKYRSQVTSALLFSFPGALTRHIFATYLNQINPNLPVGTLTANTLGTGFLAAFHVIQRTPVSASACVVLQGLIDGYCGCLSTVSSFAVEMRNLKGRSAWRYFGVSYILGQLLMVAIVGGPWWSGKVKEHSMCSVPV